MLFNAQELVIYRFSSSSWPPKSSASLVRQKAISAQAKGKESQSQEGGHPENLGQAGGNHLTAAAHIGRLAAHL
jgi:hypothetical protein